MPLLDLPPDLKMFYTIDDHTDVWSEPETVVFVHGFTENTEAWRSWVPHFSRKYRVVRYDQRGFGQSGAVAENFNFSTELIADDLARLIDAVSPHKPVHLVGGKSGGMPVIKLAVLRPHLVQSVTLVSSPVTGPGVPGWVDHMTTHGMRSWSRWTMGGRLGSKMPQRGVDWWVDLMGRTAVSTGLAYVRWVGGVDLNPELKDVQAPTLVIANDTPRRSIKEFEAYQQKIPNSELVNIPVDGYHTAAVAPDECAKVTLKFLARHKVR
jgi:3-oxoadipate enol-lactonase